MYCVRSSVVGINPAYPNKPVAVVRLSTEPNPQIWQGKTKALYIGKMAVGQEVRGLNIATKVLIPAAHEMAARRGLDEVRLDCLADNKQLRRFYRRAFTERGEIEILNIGGHKLRVARFASGPLKG